MADSYLDFNGSRFRRIGFGCWQLAGDYNLNGRPNGYGSIDLKESVRAIHIALEHGINFFDSASGYGYGKSEEVLGDALKSSPRQLLSPVICTKFSAAADFSNDIADFSEQNLVANVEGSLKRLNVSSLDILLMHNPPDDFDFSTYDSHPYDKLIQTGKIKAYGVSARTQKGVNNVLKSGFGSVVEAVYNPLDRRYAAFFSDPGFKTNYLFICRVPLASGFICERTLNANPTFPENDIRHNFNSEQVEWVSGAVRKLSFLNDLEGGIVVSALRFQMSNPFNTLAIPGIKNTSQAEDALLALRLGPLPEEVINKIAEAVPEVFYKWR